MDILSFVLGISCVVVAGMLAATVHLLLSVKRMNNDMNINNDIFRGNVDDIFKKLDETSSKIDSRFDKCMSKVHSLEINYRGRTISDHNIKLHEDETDPYRWKYNPGPTSSTEKSK